jgi:hypothetical protein
VRRPRWHRCRWYTISVEHLAPAPGQDPPHGWTIVKRACMADRCAELAASVMPGTWSVAEARGLMPWNGGPSPAAIGEAARRGGLGGVARERATGADGDGLIRDGDPFAVPGLPGPFPAPVILGEPGLVAAAAGGPPWAEAPDPGPMPADADQPARPSWAWRDPGER